jgi:hypothetical protein
MKPRGLVAVWLGLSGLTPLSAETVTLQPVADTTLFEVAPDNNLGGATFFNAGTAGNGNRNRGLILYDVTSIPAGSVITDVSVSFEVIRQPATGIENSLFSLRRVLQPWGEGAQVPESENSPGLGAAAGAGEATWNDRFAGGGAWSEAGGEAGFDYALTASALTSSAGTGDIMTFESSPDLVNDLYLWLTQPGTNFGWMLVTESEDLGKTARSFASRESGFGPNLTIHYTPVPEPGTVVLLLAALAVGAYVVRRTRA